MKQNQRKTTTPELFVLFGIFIIFVLILFHIIIITKEVIKYVNQPIYNESVMYYKCGGTKKQPMMCATIVKEKIEEHDGE